MSVPQSFYLPLKCHGKCVYETKSTKTCVGTVLSISFFSCFKTTFEEIATVLQQGTYE
jgi:hypothetical protein